MTRRLLAKLALMHRRNGNCSAVIIEPSSAKVEIQRSAILVAKKPINGARHIVQVAHESDLVVLVVQVTNFEVPLVFEMVQGSFQVNWSDFTIQLAFLVPDSNFFNKLAIVTLRGIFSFNSRLLHFWHFFDRFGCRS